MSLVELLAHPSSRLLTLALLHFLWQGLAVAGLLVLVVDLRGMRRAAARYACSLAALVAMTACPLATLAWFVASQDAPAPVSSLQFSSHELSQQASVLAPLLTQLQALQPLALAAWLAGVAVFGGRLLAGAIGLAQLRRGRLPLPRNITSIVQRLGQRMQMDALPLVFLSRQVAEAMAVGVIRPLVLIPASWATEMPLEMLEAVIAHELAHLRRRDLWVNLLQRIVETLLFYHPAVWWLSRRLRVERELCADELAVAATGRRLEYAQALERVAHRRQAEVRPALAAFLRGEQHMRLLERVRNVLGLAAGERSRLWPAGIVALALPLGLWLASLAVSVAVADDEDKRDKPAADKKRVEVRVTNRDGEEPRVEVRRDGDERKVETRDGDKPRREGERRDEDTADKKPSKDGEFRRVIVRKTADGKEEREEVVERKVDKKATVGEIRVGNKEGVTELKVAKKDGDRSVGEGARIEELTAIVKRLAVQVERLQDEVSALRGDKGESESPKPKVRASLKELNKKTSADEPKPKPEVRRLKEKPSSDESSDAELRERKEADLKKAAEGARALKEGVVLRLRDAAERKAEVLKSADAELKRADAELKKADIELKKSGAELQKQDAEFKIELKRAIEKKQKEAEKNERQ